MASEHKGIAMVILGLVAVIAIVGLVLLFVGGKGSTGEYAGEYGGALKHVEYPYWVGRGIPRNLPQEGWSLWPSSASKVAQTHWNWWDDTNDRNPVGDVPSALTACPHGMLVDYSLGQYYRSRGANVVDPGFGEQPGLCVYWPNTMVGGIAGANYGTYVGQEGVYNY